MSIKDRFPFNKLKKKRESFEGVYAGPEEMARRAGRGGGMEEVYAGPEEMEHYLSDDSPEIDLPEPMECVYAGPEVMPPESVKPVYAGPEFTATSADPQSPPPPPPMMCVYAGPDYFNGGQARPAGAFAPQQDPNARYCPNCFRKMPDTVKFCTECGTPLPKKETAE